MAPGLAADPATNRLATRAATIAAACLFAPLFVPLALGRVFSMGDLSDFHLPVRYLYRSALVEGHSVLWTDRMFGGFYIHAEGQVGAFHPLHAALYRLFPLTIAFNVELIASYVFCFAGMWSVLRRLGLSPAASLTGAIAFAFSGFNLLHLLHMNAVAVVAHVPWILLALDGVLLGDPRRQSLSVVGMAVLVGSILLLGYPQYVWIIALICAIYVLVNIRRIPRRSLLIAAGSAAAGFLIGGMQLLPTIDLLRESVRQSTTSDFALTYSLHPLNLAQLFSPYLLSSRVYGIPGELFVHEFGIYNGAFCTLAAIWVALRWRHLTLRPLAVFGVALIGVGVVLALGRYGLIYEAVAAMPLVGKFRAPARHIAMVHLGLALLAALAFDDVLRASHKRASAPGRWIWLPLAFSIGVGFAGSVWISAGFGFEGQRVDTAGAFVGAILVLVVTIWMTDAWRGSRHALIGLPVVLAVDLGVWGYGYVLPGGIRTVAEIAAQAEGPPGRSPVTVHAAEARSPNLLLLRDFGLATPYVGLYPKRQLSLVTSNELRVAGVEWLQTPEGWQRVRDPMPRLRVVPESVVAPSSRVTLEQIDITRVAIVETALPPLAQDARSDIVEDSPGHLTVDVATRGDALLVTTVAYHAGWKAVGDDGAEIRTLRVYGDFLGILAPPGQYRLDVVFQPDSFAGGVLLSIAGLATAVLLAAIAGRRRRSDHRPVSNIKAGHRDA